ncbi:hypothetical protein FHS00_003482 [Limimaricola variabilis]|uniref:Uncharacterized protein n=1 Tax=Limimaricola variabilis TaxID=1492771 RepID=A0ABR6HTI2_9RHOB|nr:hypothetical protein [Limimaricola variabilis]
MQGRTMAVSLPDGHRAVAPPGAAGGAAVRTAAPRQVQLKPPKRTTKTL